MVKRPRPFLTVGKSWILRNIVSYGRFGQFWWLNLHKLAYWFDWKGYYNTPITFCWDMDHAHFRAWENLRFWEISFLDKLGGWTYINWPTESIGNVISMLRQHSVEISNIPIFERGKNLDSYGRFGQVRQVNQHKFTHGIDIKGSQNPLTGLRIERYWTHPLLSMALEAPIDNLHTTQSPRGSWRGAGFKMNYVR